VLNVHKLCRIKKYIKTFAVPFCLCLIISGASQAPLWPACTKMISKWFPDKILGTTIGLMSTAPYVGSFASAALVSYISDRLWYDKISWEGGKNPNLHWCEITELTNRVKYPNRYFNFVRPEKKQKKNISVNYLPKLINSRKL
jgi:hypothetical protein